MVWLIQKHLSSSGTMSKIFLYLFGLVLLVAIAGFAFLAFSPVQIDQKEVVLDVSNDQIL